ncbi:ThiF family protein [Chitinophaga skermanii]|uniref:ThiF family protein n=1 Tax=Chitinophaga skermanii TaxID=331697 RepID=A0A327QI16_9BACT|nr:ThiF family adenylyltransferase [Chitinophaga skermanii]RAJ04256.1 ThiF family protein [Chitinophaga skermanii]
MTIKDRVQQEKQQEQVYQPVFYRLKDKTQQQALEELVSAHPYIRVYDEIISQLRELVKSLHPTKRLTEEEIEVAVKEHVGSTPLEQYGVWVYYPWIHKVVHIVDEEEFILLRTSRNLHKITAEERDILRKKKLGVIGLSVGQSIALTLVMERLCGEIRLSDFDALELTNMNRIRTGIHNLSIPKVIIAAREIAELDPFVKVVCYTDGATEQNLDDFLTKDGQLDILIEECDGIDIKIISRIKAKALKMPVVMEMNDRGMLDIERYDLHPDYPMMHGLIPDIDPLKLKHLSNEEKVPILGPMVGMQDMSPRMKYSLSEIGKTITTWPQLASSVVLGGAMVADTCRRILLNQLQSSGRYYVDFDKLIS